MNETVAIIKQVNSVLKIRYQPFGKDALIMLILTPHNSPAR